MDTGACYASAGFAGSWLSNAALEEEQARMAVNPLELRRVLGQFATGVTVVTSRIGAQTRGITVNSFTSVSLDPPIVLICIDNKARSYSFLPEAGVFAVNVLSEKQENISDYFARRLAPNPDDELAEIPYHDGVTECPLIDGSIAYVECRIIAKQDVGDHAIFIAEVVSASLAVDAPPLLFFRGRYPRLIPPEVKA